MKKSDKKSSNNKGVVVQIHLTNRWLYTLIALVVVFVAAVGVYAYQTTSVVGPYSVSGASSSEPNPGTSISQIQTCNNGYILEAVNGQWSCQPMPGSVPTPKTCPNGQLLYYSNGWYCVSETDPTVEGWAKTNSGVPSANAYAFDTILASNGASCGSTQGGTIVGCTYGSYITSCTCVVAGNTGTWKVNA